MTCVFNLNVGTSDWMNYGAGVSIACVFILLYRLLCSAYDYVASDGESGEIEPDIRNYHFLIALGSYGVAIAYVMLIMYKIICLAFLVLRKK